MILKLAEEWLLKRKLRKKNVIWITRKLGKRNVKETDLALLGLVWGHGDEKEILQTSIRGIPTQEGYPEIHG